MAIFGSGLISGIDTRGLISNLVELQREPIYRLQREQRSIQAEISGLASILSKMESLGSTLREMDTTTELLANTATSSNTDTLSVIASGVAATANYTVVVSSLARAEKDQSTGFASATAEVKAGTIDLAVWGEESVQIVVEDGWGLGDVRDAINSSGAEVSASIINTGTESFLSLTTTKIGHDLGGAPADALRITESYTGSTGIELAFAQTQQATNASMTIDGLSVQSTTNTLSDAITGVTISLADTSPDDVEITISPEVDAVIERISGFADNYNEVIAQLEEMAGSSSSILRIARQELQGILSDLVPGGQGSAFSNLSSIGVESEYSTGRLTIDDTVLREAITQDATAVSNIFDEPSAGVAVRVRAMIDRYIEDHTGILSISEATLNNQMDAIDERIEALERRSDSYESRLVRQYTALEQYLSDLQGVDGLFSGLVPFGQSMS